MDIHFSSVHPNDDAVWIQADNLQLNFCIFKVQLLKDQVFINLFLTFKKNSAVTIVV